MAVWPDPSTSQRLSSLELGDAGNIRPVPSGQHHITTTFEAQSFDLVGSRLADGGPRYIPLVRVPLRR